MYPSVQYLLLSCFFERTRCAPSRQINRKSRVARNDPALSKFGAPLTGTFGNASSLITKAEAIHPAIHPAIQALYKYLSLLNATNIILTGLVAYWQSSNSTGSLGFFLSSLILDSGANLPPTSGTIVTHSTDSFLGNSAQTGARRQSGSLTHFSSVTCLLGVRHTHAR